MTDTLDDLYEELTYYMEVRGELDDAGNAQTEARIAELSKEIKEVQSLGSRWG